MKQQLDALQQAPMLVPARGFQGHEAAVSPQHGARPTMHHGMDIQQILLQLPIP